MFLLNFKTRNSHMKVLYENAALKKFPKFTENSYTGLSCCRQVVDQQLY